MAGASEPNNTTPIAALRPSTKSMLAMLLDPLKVIPSENGTPRDWRGLAELGGVDSDTMSFLLSKENPTQELLTAFLTKNLNCQTFEDLTALLAVMDRFDVVDDVLPCLKRDAIRYRANCVDAMARVAAPGARSSGLENDILTIEDSQCIHNGLELPRYDAFVLYAEEDSEFANEVIDKLEKTYNLKICYKDRDLLPGVMFEYEAIGRLIEERCNRFLVIFSPNFLKSQANQYLVSYASASALGSKMRKVIPCVYQQCELPPSVRYSFCIHYNRAGKLWNFWEKLAESIKVNRVPVSQSLDGVCDPKLDVKNKSAELCEPKSCTKILESKSATDCDINFDAASISSKVELLPNATQNSSKTWYKNFKNPLKKKKEKLKYAVAQ